MNELDSEQDNTIFFTKKHEEILEIIEEIKRFEKKYQTYDLKESDLDIEFIEVEQDVVDFIEVNEDIVEFSEVEQENLEKVKSISIVKDIKKLGLKDKFIKIFPSKIGAEIKQEKIKQKDITPATFRIRFNENGELENIDLKKSKPKLKSEKHFIFKKFSFKRMENNEKTESKLVEKNSKISKLKGGLGRLGKLKKVIPSRKKEVVETEKNKTEE